MYWEHLRAVGENQAKLTMISQLVFLPSIMLSGIVVPVDILPQPLEYVRKIFPATWGYKLMTLETFVLGLFTPLVVILLAAIVACGYALSKKAKE